MSKDIAIYKNEKSKKKKKKKRKKKRKKEREKIYIRWIFQKIILIYNQISLLFLLSKSQYRRLSAKRTQFL